MAVLVPGVAAKAFYIYDKKAVYLLVSCLLLNFSTGECLFEWLTKLFIEELFGFCSGFTLSSEFLFYG